jgi:hypothetical protein
MTKHPQFEVQFDARGDLYGNEGFVICKATGAHFLLGEASPEGADVLTGQLANSAGELAEFPNAEAGTFLGGSGRNLVITGAPAESGMNGLWRAWKPGFWRRGIFTLEVTGASAATVSDGTDTVAEMTTGGTAPVGSLVASEYGEDTYNSGAAFTLTAAGETGWPGAVFDIDVGVGSGSAQGGKYEATTDCQHYESTIDPDWTITINSDGSADMKFDGTTVAKRAAGGPLDDPCGTYDSEPAGEFLNPEFDEEDDGEPGETNPFGTLELVFSWPSGMNDLDIGVTFEGETVGFGYAASATWMEWSSDNTTTGPETVTVDLAQAWEDGVIVDFANILAVADWYPPAGGSGPATVQVTYTPAVGAPVVNTYDLHPGSTTPAKTPAAGIRIGADGSMTRIGAEWSAVVMAVRRAPAAGVVYAKITEGTGEVDSVAGPFFAASLPAASGSDRFFPLAISDGTGGLKTIHSGPLVWSIGGGGGGVAFTEITEDDFLALDPPDSGTYYDITDLIP